METTFASLANGSAQSSKGKCARSRAASNKQGKNAIRFGSELGDVSQGMAYTALQNRYGVALKWLHEVRDLHGI